MDELKPLEPFTVAEGAVAYALPEDAHLLFFIKAGAVDMDSFSGSGIMPKGATGGYIIPVYGEIEEAVKIFKIDG